MTAMHTTALESITFPSSEDRKNLRQLLQKGGWSLEKSFTDQERWHWHAYDYGWRRAMLGDTRKFSPIDPDHDDTGKGKWFDPNLAAVTEKYWRAKLGKPAAKTWPSPSHPDAVRSNWRDIPLPELTRAELALALPSIDRMMEQAKANIAAAAERWRTNDRPRSQARRRNVAREIAPPIPREA